MATGSQAFQHSLKNSAELLWECGLRRGTFTFTRVMQIRTNATACATHTAAPIEPGANGSIIPEFIRVPDVEKTFGIKRGHIYALISAGAVKSVCLRKPGAKTGVRLVHFQSVRDYLNRQLA